jgi:hypothetical protein
MPAAAAAAWTAWPVLLSSGSTSRTFAPAAMSAWASASWVVAVPEALSILKSVSA